MPPAALSGLYPSMSSSRGITYRNLHKADMKKLVRILRDHPSDPSKNSNYWHGVKEAIRELPYHLRSSRLDFTHPEANDGKVKPGKLCAGHHGLNHKLIHSVWSAMRYEFDIGVGEFLGPIILHAGLPAKQEWAVRQLEPVLEMWQDDFNIDDHTPEGGRVPNCPQVMINGVRKSKWRRQSNECPACILARIGSDQYVLFALLIGILGRLSARSAGAKGHHRSKRARFVRAWIKEFPGGDELADEAWDFSTELRRVRHAWEGHMAGSGPRGFYGPIAQTGSAPAPSFPASNRSSAIGVDISGDFHPGFRPAGGKSRPETMLTVSDIGIDISEPYCPTTRFANVTPDQASRGQNERRQSRNHSIKEVPRGQPTRVSVSSPIHSQNGSIFSHASQFDSLYSWESNVSASRALSRASSMLLPPPRGRTPPQAHVDSFARTHKVTPKPSRNSIYGGFNSSSYNSELYDGFDVSPPGSPVVEHPDVQVSPRGTPKAGPSGGLGRGNNAGTRTTAWSDMY